jgi:Protein of unknown function (DUF4446)
VRGLLLDSDDPQRRNRRIDIDALVEPYLAGAVVALAVATLLLLLLVLWLVRRTRRLGRRLDALTRGQDDRDLAGVLDAHLDKVFAVSAEVDELTVRTAVAEANLRRSFQRVGLVRFNPFEDTGGNQSFALALLDANGDGLVLSSLHSRTGTRVYAKAIAGGKSEGALSEEEAQAVRDAMAGPPARTTGAA